MNFKVLIIEDDVQIQEFIFYILKENNFDCIKSSTGEEAMSILSNRSMDIILLDLGLPDADGIELIKKIREFSDLPIIIISARNEELEKVQALDLGADDYLVKPFSMNELLARIRVVIRNKINTSPFDNVEVYEKGDLKVDVKNRVVLLKEEVIYFTAMEFDILTLLVKNPGKVLTYNFILKNVWHSHYESDIKSLRVFIANIRRKLKENPIDPKYIITETKIGYRFIA